MAETSILVLTVFQQLKSKMSALIDPVVKAEGLTPLQGMVLLMVADGKVSTVSELSEEISCGQANTSTLCKKLEKGGYLTRARNPKDERMVTLSLTDRGRETLERIQSRFRQYEQLLEQMAPQIREDLSRGLAAASQTLDFLNRNIKGDHNPC